MRDFTVFNVVSLEAFVATDANEIFSGRQPHQDVKISRRFGCAARPEYGDRITVTSGNLRILTRLSARENFIHLM